MSASTECEHFLNSIGLKNGSQIQKQEMTRAFFAGQWAMYCFQLSEVSALDDTQAERLLLTRVQELDAYFRTFSTRN